MGEGFFCTFVPWKIYFLLISPLDPCAGIEVEKAAGMSSVVAAGDDSNAAEPQLDSGSHCHGGALAEVGGLEEETGNVGVVVEEQALAAENDQQGEDTVVVCLQGLSIIARLSTCSRLIAVCWPSRFKGEENCRLNSFRCLPVAFPARPRTVAS